MEVETLKDKLVEVESKALIATLADRLVEVEIEKLGEILAKVQA